MFEPTKNIDNSFRAMRSLMLLIVCACFLICAFALYKNAQLAASVQDKVYILANGKALEVFASSRKENIPVEARDHVAMFHTYFFSLDPDEKAIAANIKRALYMADGTAKSQYDALVETGYIAGIISGNISQQIAIDSVQLNTNGEPYQFRCYATLKIIRPTSTVTRSLVTQGSLRNITRTDHNPHGFLIERWETIENKDLKIEKR